MKIVEELKELADVVAKNKKHWTLNKETKNANRNK